MEEKIDLRIQKTHRALLGALRELLSEKSFDEISVSELCDRAQTRRATFYKHFADKTELLAYMIQELQQEYNTRTETALNGADPGAGLVQIFRYLLDFLDENRGMVRTILNSNGKNVVLDVLGEQLERDLKSHFRAAARAGSGLRQDPELLAVTYSGAVIHCAQWWLTRGSRLTKDQVVQQFAQLVQRP